jgi:hypothetical protein
MVKPAEATMVDDSSNSRCESEVDNDDTEPQRSCEKIVVQAVWHVAARAVSSLLTLPHHLVSYRLVQYSSTL